MVEKIVLPLVTLADSIGLFQVRYLTFNHFWLCFTRHEVLY